MLRRPHLLLALFLNLAALPALAEPDRQDATEPVSVRQLRGLDARMTVTLRAAHKLASQRVAERSTCGALFGFGDEPGEQILRNMRFGVEEGEACSRGIAATTTVGGSLTRLCRPWLPRLDRHELAALLIHEALHQAGLSEWPHDPDAMTSQQINRLVSKECGL